MPKRTQSSPEARSAHKLDPMLRVVANGSDAVNALRADSSGCVASVYGAAEPTTGALGEALGEALAVSRRALRGELLDPEAARPTRGTGVPRADTCRRLSGVRCTSSD